MTPKDVRFAAREGFTSGEPLKRYTTFGMATDQGRTSNFASLATMADATEKTSHKLAPQPSARPFSPCLSSPFQIAAREIYSTLSNPWN